MLWYSYSRILNQGTAIVDIFAVMSQDLFRESHLEAYFYHKKLQ